MFCTWSTVVRESIGLWGRICIRDWECNDCRSVSWVTKSIGLWGRIWLLFCTCDMLVIARLLDRVYDFEGESDT
jgi:hypothetical protein